MTTSAAPQPLVLALRCGLEGLGLAMSEKQQAQLLHHLALVSQWCRVYNLTAVRDPADMLTQHCLDSLAIVRPLHRHLADRAADVLDVGSGAGFPGVVLAIACPQLGVTCVDAVAKKVSFVRHVAGAVGLPRLTAVHGRVEALAACGWDVVVSRAFASLADFVSLTRPLLKESGVWLAMKGQVPEKEILDLPEDIDVFHVERLQVPGLGAQRCLIWMRLRDDTSRVSSSG